MWYSSINIYNLADVEASWILYEEGMLPLLPTLSHFPLLTTLQLSQHVLECSAIKCTNYVVKIATNYQSYQLVFINESSCDRQTTYRNHAWAIGGWRAVRKTFFVRGQRYMCYFFILYLANLHYRYYILPVLCHKGILNVDIIKGSYDTTSFALYLWLVGYDESLSNAKLSGCYGQPSHPQTPGHSGDDNKSVSLKFSHVKAHHI